MFTHFLPMAIHFRAGSASGRRVTSSPLAATSLVYCRRYWFPSDHLCLQAKPVTFSYRDCHPGTKWDTFPWGGSWWCWRCGGWTLSQVQGTTRPHGIVLGIVAGTRIVAAAGRKEWRSPKPGTSGGENGEQSITVVITTRGASL